MVDQVARAEPASPAPRTLGLAEASRRRRRTYLWAVAAIATVGTALLPFAGTPLPAVPEFNVVYVTGVLFGDTATAFLLFGQFRASGRASLLVLASAYLLTAAIVVPHLVLFSEFAPTPAWRAAAPQAAAWLWHAWHLAFPLAVLGYAALERRRGDSTVRRRSVPIAVAVGCVLGLAIGLTVLFTLGDDALPELHDGRTWNPITFRLGWAMGLATLAALVAVLTLPSRRRVLHLWLAVALVAFLFDIIPNMVALERFALGWYAGRVSGLLASTFLFAMLLRETARLYVSLGAALDRVATVNAELERRVQERTAALTAANASLANAVEERDVLLGEVYHRVNNNLQTIAGLLSMERRRLADDGARAALERMAGRARAMGLVHQRVMEARELHAVDLAKLLRDLAESLGRSLALERRGIAIAVDAEETKARLDVAMPLGLLVNEFVSNAVEHAFAGRTSGHIAVSLRREDDMLRLEVADDGVGMAKAQEGLGARIVAGLVAQLDGRQEIVEERGVRRRVLFRAGKGEA